MPLGALDELKLRSQFYFRAYDKCSLGVEKYVPCGNRRLWISLWDCAPHQVTRMLSIRGAPPPVGSEFSLDIAVPYSGCCT